jgi:hypothetical protein
MEPENVRRGRRGRYLGWREFLDMRYRALVANCEMSANLSPYVGAGAFTVSTSSGNNDEGKAGISLFH